MIDFIFCIDVAKFHHRIKGFAPVVKGATIGVFPSASMMTSWYFLVL
jgi:hypothetical protein